MAGLGGFGAQAHVGHGIYDMSVHLDRGYGDSFKTICICGVMFLALALLLTMFLRSVCSACGCRVRGMLHE